ncbi:MAG: glycosyltransferase [Methylococcales bacterium]|nr:glycosyltransferase [Methylococcales bacterium]MDD5630682.1 glycosyltransferase [Methylococcales bacterium]
MQQCEVVKSLSAGCELIGRIVLIGPVLPYRGGIAQHTTMLHRALREQVECLTVSFSRQYPRWLFPGKNDKDENLGGYTEDGVEYLIDSINPLSWARAVKRIRAFAPHIVVFPWWHVYWAPCFAWLCKQLKRDNIEIVFLCHNAVEHESAHWKRLISNFVLSSADRFVVHTSIDKENLLKCFPNSPVGIHPLPIFDCFPQPIIKLPRRASLELLFFGFVRPYKGLDILLEAMTLLKDEDVYLSIVGEFWNGESETHKYITDNNIANKIEMVAHYIPDDEVAAYFARCDVVVLPYLSATGSAVIPLAYHYGKPVIATQVGGIPDVVVNGATGTLIEPGSSPQLVMAIKNALLGTVSYEIEEINKIKSRLTWEGLAMAVIGMTSKYKSDIDQSNTATVRTHAILDIISRESKAKKIVALVSHNGVSSFRKVLEVGTGSGLIAGYFSKLKNIEVYAVDVADERQITEGFQFQQVQDTSLPFVDEMFDFVISNHVVEHVGTAEDQTDHLREIFRCLEPGGTLYFAVPNRWRLIEPHYKLPLLSWVPDKIASTYVRLFKLGSHYDCKPLSRREALDLLTGNGFTCVDATLDAISIMGEIEGGWLTRYITRLPKAFWHLFFVIMPTLIFVCRKPSI